MSGIATGTALAIAGIAGAGASVAGGIMGSNAATTAAGDQSSAAEQAAQLQYQASQNALGFQEQQYNQSQANAAPWLQSGTSALNNLDYLMGIGGNTSGTGAPATGVNGASTAVPGMATNGPSATGTPALPGNGRPQALAVSGQGSLNGASAPTNTSMGATSFLGGTQGTAQAPSGTLIPGPNGTSTASPATGGAATPASSTVNTSLGGYGSLMQPYGQTFTAPTAAQALASPGEQAELQLGDQSMQQSAAAKGSLLTGGTLQALDAYGQNLASTDYQNVYNNAYNTFSSGYNQYQNQQTNEYNRLAAMAGMGQTTASQLGTLGQNAANGVTSNLLGTASAIGQDTQNAAAANASGVVGSANAYGSALGGASNSLSNLALLNQLSQSQGSANYTGGTDILANAFS